MSKNLYISALLDVYGDFLGEKPKAFLEYYYNDDLSLSEIAENGVTVTDKNGNTSFIEADSVIVSIGYKPAPIARKQKNVHIVGDAHKVGSLRTVIWQAWDVAMKL